MCAFARDFHATWPGPASGLGERRRSCLRSEPARVAADTQRGCHPGELPPQNLDGYRRGTCRGDFCEPPSPHGGRQAPARVAQPRRVSVPAGPRGRRWRRLPTPEAMPGDPSRSWQSRGLIKNAGQAMAWSVERSRPRCTSTKRLTDAQGAIRGVNTTVHSSV